MRVRRFVVRAMALGLALAFVISSATVALAAEPMTIDIIAAGRPFVFTGDESSVPGFVAGIVAPQVDVAAVNATRKVNAKRRRLEFKGGANGYVLDQAGSVAAINAEIVRRTTDASATPQSVSLPGTGIVPKTYKFGKSIFVVLKERRIYLYDNASVVKKYRCAIGMPRYPTPTGTFTIARKVKMPSWTNPGGAWGRGMPRYIKPGPRNPLGTRALYLYRKGRDTGIRFHGTTNVGSIGHAASHGCMRMRRADVEKFYNLVPVGTPVFIVK